MPIYEYYCPANNKLYSFLVRSADLRDRLPACPDDPALALERRVSNFAIIGRAKEETQDDPFAGLDDAKVESLMADMESELGDLDEDNPNPRQLGHFMRKLTEVMGAKAPAELREVVRRLEAGEDPEKLESQFGDIMGEDGDDAWLTQVKSIIRSARQPVRDPKLYDIRDYLRPEDA